MLWNTVESIEKRKDAQLAREMDIALPRELSASQRLNLIRVFVKDQFVSLGMVADFAIHDDGTNNNPHAHVMLGLRQVTAWGFRPVKTREWNSKKMLEHWREQWAVYTNRSLAKIGSTERIDHRTLMAQGVDRKPTIHEGSKAREYAAKEYVPPSSKVRHVEGWGHRSYSVPYRLVDSGRSRVAYNHQIQLENMRRDELNTFERAVYDSFTCEPPLTVFSTKMYLVKRSLWAAQLQAENASQWLAKLQGQHSQLNEWQKILSLQQWFAFRKYFSSHRRRIWEAKTALQNAHKDMAKVERDLKILEFEKSEYELKMKADKLTRQVAACLDYEWKLLETALVSHEAGRRLEPHSHAPGP